MALQVCPELLPFQAQPFNDLLATVRQQQELVDDESALKRSVISSAAKAEASGLLGAAVAAAGGGDEPLHLKIAVAVYQQDTERVRFLLAAYTRTRLKKVSRVRGGGHHHLDVRMVAPAPCHQHRATAHLIACCLWWSS